MSFGLSVFFKQTHEIVFCSFNTLVFFPHKFAHLSCHYEHTEKFNLLKCLKKKVFHAIVRKKKDTHIYFHIHRAEMKHFSPSVLFPP